LRQGDRIHDLAGPGILDFEGLLVFKGLGAEGSKERYSDHALKVVGEKGSHSDGAQLVRYGSAPKDIGGDTRGQRASDLELKGEEVTAGFEGSGMPVGTFEERPIVVADDICERACAVDEPGRSQHNLRDDKRGAGRTSHSLERATELSL
jgi:hypothetical protein